MADRRLLTRRERRKSVAIKERSPRLLQRSLNDEIEATLSNAWLELTQFRPDAEIPLFIRPVRYRRLPMETRNALSREKELFPNDGAATGRARFFFGVDRSRYPLLAKKKRKKLAPIPIIDFYLYVTTPRACKSVEIGFGMTLYSRETFCRRRMRLLHYTWI